MKPEEVLTKYGTRYNFEKNTKISANSLSNWLKWGYIPEGAQLKLERITKGELKADWPQDEEKS